MRPAPCRASRNSATGSPRSRRRRRSPRPCRWWRRPSCAVPRRPPWRRGPSPSAWSRCSPIRRRGVRPVAGARAAGRHRLAADAICCSSAPPSAACAAPSTPRSCAWRASVRWRWRRDGKDGQDPSASAARARPAAPRVRAADRRDRRAARVRTLGFDDAETIARKSSSCSRPASSTSHAVLLPLQVGDHADPTAQQIIPADAAGGATAARRGRSTSTSPTRTRSSPTCCRATSPSRSSARCWRMPPPSRARA